MALFGHIAVAVALALVPSLASAQPAAAKSDGASDWLILASGWLAAAAVLCVALLRSRRRRRSDGAAADPSTLFATALSHLPVSVALFDANERLVAWNEVFKGSSGYPAEAFLKGVTFEELTRLRFARGDIPEEARGREADWIRERLEIFRSPTGVIELQIAGRRRLVRSARLPDGGIVVIATDMTEQTEREQALRRSEERFRTLLDALPDGVMVHDGMQVVYANQALAAILGAASPEELLGTDPIDTVAPEERWRIAPRRENLKTGVRGQPVLIGTVRRDGSVVQTERLAVATVWQDQPAYLVVVHDVSGRVSAEARARLLTDAVETINGGVIVCDPDDRIVYCNALFRRRNPAMAGKQVPGTPFEDFLRTSAIGGDVPDAKGREDDWLRERMERHRSPRGAFEQGARNGTYLLITEERLSNGYTVTFSTDITAFKQTEEKLKQSQKMEAVGQLTGGVAHDFNNLLTVILGNLQMLAERRLQDAADRALIAPALRAAERGATLTQRLLAFSRRQPLQPKAVDVGRSIRDMTDLLRRALGETIEIETIVDAGLWLCETDPVQLENALLNLAINARDAMPNGGRLTIEAGNARLDEDYVAGQIDLKAGRYVAISVTDTGTGMAPDIARRVFEPFFTTKQPGQGTGLGLSMVYGFVKQSEGHVTVYSEPGVGTTFRLYLPRLARDAAAAPDNDMSEADRLAGDGETVLVVEDDPDVRALTMTLVKDSGYVALQAASAAAALALAQRTPKIDLLLTDIVLPGGMSGRALADELCALRPDLRVVYMSGYSENAVIHHGRLDEGVHLLQKPFRRLDLQRKLRAALRRD